MSQSQLPVGVAASGPQSVAARHGEGVVPPGGHKEHLYKARGAPHAGRHEHIVVSGVSGHHTYPPAPHAPVPVHRTLCLWPAAIMA